MMLQDMENQVVEHYSSAIGEIYFIHSPNARYLDRYEAFHIDPHTRKFGPVFYRMPFEHLESMRRFFYSMYPPLLEILKPENDDFEACDEDQDSNQSFGAERNPDGSINQRREAALDRIARLTYEFDRDL